MQWCTQIEFGDVSKCWVTLLPIFVIFITAICVHCGKFFRKLFCKSAENDVENKSSKPILKFLDC